MRILILSSHFDGDRRSAGGRCALLARSLVAQGADVEVIAGGPSRSGDPAWVERVPEYPPIIPSWDEISGALHTGLGMLERGIAASVSKSFDVVHAFGWTTAYPGLALRRSFGVPLVSTLDAVPERTDARGDELIHQTTRWLARGCTRVTVPSQAAREAAVTGLDLTPDRIDVIDLGRSRDPATRIGEVYRAATREPTSGVTRLEASAPALDRRYPAPA